MRMNEINLDETMCRLLESLEKLRALGEDLAAAEKDYKIEMTKEVFKLKDGGMPATLINQIIYGLEPVAMLRFKRDVAEAMYKSTQEAINVYKLQLRLIESQIEREYSAAHRM